MEDFTADRYRIKIDEVRNESPMRGLPLGHKHLDEHWSYAGGRPLVIYGMPRSGKTEVMFEILIQLSILHNKKHFIISPETGDVAEVYTELMSKYIGKPIQKNKQGGVENKYAMSDAEFENAYGWVREHFYVVDPLKDLPKGFDIKEVYELKDEVEANSNWNFETIVIDTWLELSSSEPIYTHVDKVIKEARLHDQREKTTTIFTVHANDSKVYFDKTKNKEYYPRPKPQEMSGGKAWFRLGYTIIAVYRPDPDIFMCADNESWIIFDKIKPKRLGKVGSISWFWDWKVNRFYERHDNNNIFGATKNDIDVLPRIEVEEDTNFEDLF